MSEREERVWAVVRAAFEAHEPVPRERRRWPVVAALAAAALVAAAASPPGSALLGELRKAVGVERAEPALFRLPAPGHLLTVSRAGAWVVHEDGSKRLLGPYRDAAWSPFGRFVVATRANELVTLEPDGDVRWTLARPRPKLPRWGGTTVDTRIAYRRGDELRVVAGDGTGDHRLARLAADAPVAWRPGPAHVLAYVRRDGFVRVVDADRGTVLAKQPVNGAFDLQWVADRLLVLSRDSLRLLDDSGAVVLRRRGPVVAAALAPRAQAFAVVRAAGSASKVEVVSRRGGRAREVFAATGRFADLAWSPDGRWLVVAWPAADQLVFVRVEGRRRIVAVSNVAAQLGGFPRITGWCCSRA